MGKPKLGDFIRKIDYLGARPQEHYKNEQDSPVHQLKDVETQYSDISFEELKGAFSAFVEKVGIKDFPPKGSPSHNVAFTTIDVLRGLTSHLKSKDGSSTPKLTQVVFQTLVDMLKAGAGSTHCDTVKELFAFQKIGIDVDKYAQTLKEQEVETATAAVKVDFTYISNDFCSEEKHFDLQNEVLKRFILMFRSTTSVKLALRLVRDMLMTGKKYLVELAGNTLEALRKSKLLDWKQHVEEAGGILKAVGDVLNASCCRECQGFLDKLMAMLKKGKIIHKLQPQLMQVFFTCLSEGSGEMVEIAYECSGDEKMDFTKSPELRLEVLEKIPGVLKNEKLPWDSWRVTRAIENIMKSVVSSFESTGISKEENDLMIALFKQCSEGNDSIEEHWFQEEDEETPNMNFEIWRVLVTYAGVCDELNALLNLEPIMPEVFRWAKLAADEEHKEFASLVFDIMFYVNNNPPVEFKCYVPDIIDLMLKTQHCRVLETIVMKLYPNNPEGIHSKLQDICDNLEDMKDDERSYLLIVINEVAQLHPEVFTHDQIQNILDWYQKATSQHEKNIIVILFKHISAKHPKGLVEFFPQMCDDSIFTPETLNFRCNTVACIGLVNQKLGQQAIDYLMKFLDYTDGMIALYCAGALKTLMKKHVDYMQKYKAKLKKVQNTGKVPQLKDLAHDMILVLEGKSVEKIADDVQQQQEDIADLDEKVDVTINTVVSIGDKVIEHDKEIGELDEGMERVEERVDDVEKDMGETKIKIEEIDNKTMTNAPKWSRDLTKLMNPEAEYDWRLLASRLGYSNDDIRGWATQHDPCMSLLSEWYATHKTSEASYAILTALTEMNRLDGAAIVENAMKQAEGVVADEEFEYPSPPPVFISYQWGFQNEVKLLKQHLNMAGYECWMDVGQMGGGDKLFAKIDNGIRGAKIVICCVTEKYAQSPNCNREVNLSVNLNKPIIPLLMEKMDWPPKGSMGPIFSEYLFIRFFQRGGEETPDNDKRYWPIPKFQELLMQLNFFVVPDQKLVQKEYARWWAPITEDIVIDKNRGKKQSTAQKQQQNEIQVAQPESPLVFLSYQWGKQPQVKALYQHLTSIGYTVWMDIYQMGGGDSLYDKIDKGMRGCKAVISCVTQKYSLSANCRREVSLADALKKPIIPLLLDQIKWPPDGPMSMVFTELLYVSFCQDEAVQLTWKGDQFDELRSKLCQFIPEITSAVDGNDRNYKLLDDQNKAMHELTAGKEKKASVSKESKGNGPKNRPGQSKTKTNQQTEGTKEFIASSATTSKKAIPVDKTDISVTTEETYVKSARKHITDDRNNLPSKDNHQVSQKKDSLTARGVIAKAASVDALNKDRDSTTKSHMTVNKAVANDLSAKNNDNKKQSTDRKEEADLNQAHPMNGQKKSSTCNIL